MASGVRQSVGDQAGEEDLQFVRKLTCGMAGSLACFLVGGWKIVWHWEIRVLHKKNDLFKIEFNHCVLKTVEYLEAR